MDSKSPKSFGGKWSDLKLTALRQYLSAYTRVLQNQPFAVGYIDAFAGAGTHEVADQPEELSDLQLMEETEKFEEQYRHGSPFIALQNDPPFDGFVFIDQNEDSIERLKSQIDESGLQSKKIKYVVGDANSEIAKLCDADWKMRRAVAFLDPFATQVEWKTIEKIASTKAIDMWLLFPAMAINRMLTKSGKMEEAWEKKLTSCFGTGSWRDEFYHTETQDTLFGDVESTSKVPEIFDQLGKFVIRRLQENFAGVYSKPLVLRNSSNTPIFLLCFACGNERGSKPALRIAGHIIDKIPK